jgi:hypothetical protein
MTLRRLRVITDPFVVASPAGARVRTRLQVSKADEDVLRQIGAHLGRLASADLAQRCQEGCLDAKAKAQSRRRRKREMTAASLSAQHSTGCQRTVNLPGSQACPS